MENVLLGATDSVVTYDGSGVFSNTTPSSDVDPNYNPAPAESETEEASEKPAEPGSNNLLMYAGAALLLYFFVFKKK